jgi:hypothetical protein
MTRPRRWSRLCRYSRCRLPFDLTTRERKLGIVYCCAECGRAARGRDSLGRIVKWWLPQYRRSA